MPDEPRDEVLNVTVRDGMVIVEVGSGSVTLTPAVALNAGMQIMEHAVQAMNSPSA